MYVDLNEAVFNEKKINKIYINHVYIDCLLKKEFEEQSSEEDFWSSPKYNRRDNAHSLFQYPAMMVPLVQRNLIEKIRNINPTIKNVFDPFMGGGTSIMASMYNGLNCYGQDINPLSILLSQVKTGPYDCELFHERIKVLKCEVNLDMSDKISINFSTRDKWFKNEVSIELSKLRRAILKEEELHVRRFFWVTLAETIRLTSNDRISTYKLHARTLDEIENRDVSPISEFFRLIDRNLVDLKKCREELINLGLLENNIYIKDKEINLNDSSEEIDFSIINNKKECFDMVLSSPPYGDNITTVTYGQHSYLPLQWIELSDISPKIDKSFISTTQEIDKRSLGGVQTKINQDELHILFAKTPTLKEKVEYLNIEHKDKINKVIKFIYDFDKSLDKITEVTKKDGYMVWTIGNRRVGNSEVRNDLILTELLESKGVKLVTQIQRDIKNKRMPSRNKITTTMNSEKILIFRKN